MKQNTFWHTSRFKIDLSKPVVMGIVNVTPDSFSDGGKHSDVSQAIRHAEKLLYEGADILDFGAESTRPSATAIGLDEELKRLIPVLEQALHLGVPISVDTYKSGVMRQVLDMGVDIINDIWALRQDGALEAVAQHSNCGLCLMHMHRTPQLMQVKPMQGLVVPTIKEFLLSRVQAVIQSGLQAERIVLDPGFGFGKSVEQNFELLAGFEDLSTLHLPLLMGCSRKNSLGEVTRRNVDDRVVASVVAAVLALNEGYQILRVHDVAQTVDAVKIWQKLQQVKTTLV